MFVCVCKHGNSIGPQCKHQEVYEVWISVS